MRSMTALMKGKGTGLLENDTIREYNSMLKQMAEENGWEQGHCRCAGR